MSSLKKRMALATLLNRNTLPMCCSSVTADGKEEESMNAAFPQWAKHFLTLKHRLKMEIIRTVCRVSTNWMTWVGLLFGVLTCSPVLHHHYCAEKHQDFYFSLEEKSKDLYSVYKINLNAANVAPALSCEPAVISMLSPSRSRRSFRPHVPSPGARTPRGPFVPPRMRQS